MTVSRIDEYLRIILNGVYGKDVRKAIYDGIRTCYDDNATSPDGVKAIVDEWLEEHPEVTTTVEDGAITEVKINNSFLGNIKNRYVTPEAYGAVGDGVTDDTEAFLTAIESGKNIVIPNKSYYLSDFIWTDDTVIVEDHGVYTGKRPYISKALRTSPVSIEFEKSIWNSNFVSDPSTVYVNGVVYDSDNNVVVMSFSDSNEETTYIVTTDTSFNKIAEYVSSIAGHATGGAYNSKTKKVYFATGTSSENTKACIVEYISTSSGVITENLIELTNFPQTTCSAIVYDENNDVYFIRSGGYIYLVDSNFTYIETTPMEYGSSFFADSVGIPEDGIVAQSMMLKDGQLLHLWHNGSEDYTELHDSLSYWISQYNYADGSLKASFKFNSIASHDEIEAMCEIDGKIYIFQALRNTMTFVSRVYLNDPIYTSKNEAVNTAIPSGANLNNIIRFGMYNVRDNDTSASLINAPFSSAFILYVLPNAFGDYVTQIVINVVGGVAVRVYDKVHSTWFPWKHLNNVEEITFTPVQNTCFTDNGTKIYKQGGICLVKIDGSLVSNNSSWEKVGTVEYPSNVTTTPVNGITNSGTICRIRVLNNDLQMSYGGSNANIGTEFFYMTN